LICASCTKSDGHDSSRTLSAKIDGTIKYFKDITVEEDVNPDYTDFIITGKQADDPSKVIILRMEKGVTGTQSMYYIQYFNNSDYFDSVTSGLNANISENSDIKLIATFSSNLDDGDGNVVQVTQGILNINF
jgi:hypothetical protein